MIHTFPVVFFNGGTPLAGIFYRNTPALDVAQPVVLVTGSWLTVKEQMADTYASALAERGYATFTFDFSGFGASGGAPRHAEIPARKIGDLTAAATFVRTMGFAQTKAVGHLAVCASAQYGLAAIAAGAGIDSLVSVAGWFHDPASVANFYGGSAGVAAKVAQATRAVEQFQRNGEVAMTRAYAPGDGEAGMAFEMDYYANPKRGAVPSWRNEMAVMSWLPWLGFDGLRAAAQVRVPTLLIHGDGCALPANARRVHAALSGPKQLVWTEGGQTDFYDLPPFVTKAVEAADAHFKLTL